MEWKCFLFSSKGNSEFDAKGCPEIVNPKGPRTMLSRCFVAEGRSVGAGYVTAVTHKILQYLQIDTRGGSFTKRQKFREDQSRSQNLRCQLRAVQNVASPL